MRASVCDNQVYANRGALDAEVYCSTGLPKFVKLSFLLLTVFLKLCRGGSVTNLVKSLRKRGKYLDEDLIAYILYETLKVNTAKGFSFSVFDPSTGYDFDEKERHKTFIV